jgi:hypothetical protein
MSEAIGGSPRKSAAGAGPSGDVVRSPRWTRTHTIWLLIALSLSPGVAAASARDWWEQLPPGVRLSAYILSGILVVAACSLMFLQDDPPGGKQP